MIFLPYWYFIEINSRWKLVIEIKWIKFSIYHLQNVLISTSSVICRPDSKQTSETEQEMKYTGNTGGMASVCIFSCIEVIQNSKHSNSFYANIIDFSSYLTLLFWSCCLWGLIQSLSPCRFGQKSLKTILNKFNIDQIEIR